MVAQPPDAPAAASGATPAATTPDLAGLASTLAAKHAAAPGTAPAPKAPLPGKPPVLQPGKSGRKSTAEEAAAYLARNGLVAVPAAAAVNPAGDPGGVPAVPGYVVSPEFVATCCETLLKGVEAYRQRAVFLTVRDISGGDAKLAGDYAKDAGAPPGCIEVMGKCAAEIAQKYALLNSWSPEVFLAVAGSTWIAKEASLQKRLTELARIRAEALKKAAQPPTA